MSVTQPASPRRTVGTEVRRRLASTISRFADCHVSAQGGQQQILISGLAVAGASCLIVLLWRDLPDLYQVRAGGGTSQYDASPLTGPFRVLLGALLLTGIGVLLVPELSRRAGSRRTTAPVACPARITRMTSSLGNGGRRRGGYARWPIHQPGRLLHPRQAAPHRTVTRGFHGGHRALGHHGEAVHHAPLQPMPSAVHGHGLHGSRRRPVGSGLAVHSAPGGAHRASLTIGYGAGVTPTAGRGGSPAKAQLEQRAETVALTLLTGYTGLLVIGVGAALNSGVSMRDTIRGFATAVLLGLAVGVPLLLRQDLSDRDQDLDRGPRGVGAGHTADSQDGDCPPPEL